MYFLSIVGNGIIGIPAKEYQRYTNKINKISHLNSKSDKELRKLCDSFFSQYFHIFNE